MVYLYMASNTFKDIVQNILNNFEINYTSIHELEQIKELITGLSYEEKIDNQNHIHLILKTIKGFGQSIENKRLTNRQINTLKNVLESGETAFQNKQINRSKNRPKYGETAFQNKQINRSENIPKYGETLFTVKQLPTDDIIFTVISELLINLDRNSLDSCLNVYVLEYYSIITDILAMESSDYVNVTNEINDCLIKHGWGFQSKSGQGFHTSPNRKELINDLVAIMNKYF